MGETQGAGDVEPRDSPPTGHELDDIENNTLARVFCLLSSEDVARCAAVQKRWHALISEDDHLWRVLVARDYALEEPKDPSGQELSSFRATFCAWREHFGSDHQFAGRAVTVWGRLERWVKEHCPYIWQSVLPPSTEGELAEVEAEIGSLPKALRALYKVHGGQYTKIDRALDETPSNVQLSPDAFHGLLGSYSFYDHWISCRPFPLHRIISDTNRLREEGVVFDSYDLGRKLVLGGSFNFEKRIFVDMDTADVSIGMRGLMRFQQAHPVAEGKPGEGDGVLRWLEHYADCLESGVYRVDRLLQNMSRSTGISLFPQAPPRRVAEVTRGIQVAVGTIMIPECSATHAGGESYFAYSVRFSMLSAEDQLKLGAADVLRQAQLISRHWQILDGKNNQVEEVSGKGVIGQQPILEAGGDEFVYQSCTAQIELKSAMQGTFQFVAGKISAPQGDEFDVACPRFTLDATPDYVY